MKALTLAAAFALALPGFALAQTGTHSPGASGFAPGHEQKTPGGAAAVSPGHEMQDARLRPQNRDGAVPASSPRAIK